MATGICPECPLASAFDGAEALLESLPHPSANRTMGGIALSRAALIEAANRVQCTQESIGPSGQLQCPLTEVATTIRMMASTPWPPQQFLVDLDSLGKDVIAKAEVDNASTQASNSGTGQYL